MEANFCPGCGVPVPLVCRACHLPISSGSNFCMHCGTHLGKFAILASSREFSARVQQYEGNNFLFLFEVSVDLLQGTKQLNSKIIMIGFRITHLQMHSWCRQVAVARFVIRKRSCGKVMFLHLSVILSTGGGCVFPSAYWDTPLPGQTPPGQTPPPPADDYCCGRYASYWNAFLFLNQCTYRGYP